MIDQKLITFLKLCELMNYRKTAEALHLTQPAVSNQIKQLEQVYQCKLFLYDKKRLHKTTEAAMLEHYVENLIYQESQFIQALSSHNNKRFLHIGATKTIGEYVIKNQVSQCALDNDNQISVTIDNTKKLLSYIDKGLLDFGEFETGDIEKTLFPLLAKNNNLGYYKEDDLFWMAIDTNKELETVKKEYKNKTDKPWGYEKILVYTDKYLTKELYLKEGFQTSLHYHDKKDETMYILSGSGYIEFEDKKEYFGKNDSIRIKPGVIHSIVASENTVLHEVSTPFLDDTIRKKDFYQRN